MVMQVLPGFRLGECGATADPESVRDRTKRDAEECSMDEELERRPKLSTIQTIIMECGEECNVLG